MSKNKVDIIKEGYQPKNGIRSSIGEFGYKPVKEEGGGKPPVKLPKGDLGTISKLSKK